MRLAQQQTAARAQHRCTQRARLVEAGLQALGIVPGVRGESLSVEDFARILTSTDACLTRQYSALLGTDGVTLDFTADGIRRLAEVAWSVNERTENIGARRLHTVMEKLLEDVSFDAGRHDSALTVDAAYVDVRLGELSQSEDLARYVL